MASLRSPAVRDTRLAACGHWSGVFWACWWRAIEIRAREGLPAIDRMLRIHGEGLNSSHRQDDRYRRSAALLNRPLMSSIAYPQCINAMLAATVWLRHSVDTTQRRTHPGGGDGG